MEDQVELEVVVVVVAVVVIDRAPAPEILDQTLSGLIRSRCVLAESLQLISPPPQPTNGAPSPWHFSPGSGRDLARFSINDMQNDKLAKNCAFTTYRVVGGRGSGVTVEDFV